MNGDNCPATAVEIPVTNIKKYYCAKVKKIDSDTKETIKDKFIFGIYEDPECTKLIKEVKSNKEDGTALFEELRYGTYYIKEIKAPKDYELSSRIAKVEINDKGIFVDDEQVEEKDSTIEFTFENKKIEVPKTGDESKIKLFAGAVISSYSVDIYSTLAGEDASGLILLSDSASDASYEIVTYCEVTSSPLI